MGSWSTDQSRLGLASAEADFGGVQLRGIQSLSISDSLDTDPMYGNGSTSIGAPVGMHKAEGQLVTIPEEADSCLQSLGNAFGRVLGSIGLTMAEPDGSGIYSVQLNRVKITKVELNPGEAGGQKGATKTISFIVLDPVDWNGISIIENPNSLGLADVINFAVSASI